ncbi:hypothetical protein PRZ48_007940 [Zasmidium cellare]|uniref:Uncharacterized protein n=1 Tax=Zasmidium cellare TaxID=395010 RepID=A0ABR0EEE6_ZASCE|nr:hypothetical protein PRZ48_007940 [Zasmidium cellare]
MLAHIAGVFSLCIAATIAGPIVARQACTNEMKINACKAEIQTIRSHSLADAAKIPLAPLATRTFYVTPSELGGVTLPPINVGITADTVRGELVALATILNAGVPQGSDSYIVNPNGTVTSDFIQTDRVALPSEQVREIHEFNDACQITKITGYVHGKLLGL